MAARKAHVEGATPVIDLNQLPYLGVTLAKHALKEGEPPDINGSLMVIKADSEKSVRGFLEVDAYTKAGVWDVAQAKILPFKAG